MIFQLIAGLLLLLITVVILYLKFAPQFGTRSTGVRMEKITNSPNFREGKFQNLVPTPMAAEHTSMIQNGLKFFTKSNNRDPVKVVKTIKFDRDKFLDPQIGTKFSWFGHSSFMLNIAGKIILIDPVFSEKASPVSFLGVKRFEYSNQYASEDLPEIDLLLISHDHYDHLDYKTILNLHQKVKLFYVPLGVAAHLIHWGVPETKILEFDWWESSLAFEGLEIIAAPARHFSGRAGFDKDNTLWCSWIILAENLKLYYSGDSGYEKHFAQIGEKFGPFDICFMECGQYNEGWPFIHMMPEESVKACKELNSAIMVPVHWGKFKLSLHSPTEPIERARKEAVLQGVNLIIPTPGEILTVEELNDPEKAIKIQKDFTGNRH